jgi:hypothetical protein
VDFDLRHGMNFWYGVQGVKYVCTIQSGIVAEFPTERKHFLAGELVPLTVRVVVSDRNMVTIWAPSSQHAEIGRKAIGAWYVIHRDQLPKYKTPS